MALTQANRLLELKTPLGKDALVLAAFHGHEEISRLFSFELELISDNPGIAAPSIVGKNVTFSVKQADNTPRFFNGHISRFQAGDESHGRRNYRAQVVPWLWFLTRTSDCRIFQNKSVPEIIQQIFGDLGFSDFDKKHVVGHHPKREYCVQYRETDFNFVSRLMEEEGIFYFFKHEDGKHTLVMSDEKGAYYDCREKTVDFPRDYGSRAIHDHITAWEHRYEFRTGKYAQTDYNFETPTVNLMTNTSTVVPLPDSSKYEFYDYPGTGTYFNKANGTPLTGSRMEEEEVDYDTVYGSSKCRSFTPGGKFKINKHRSATEQGKTFVISAIQHSATEPLAHEGGGYSGEDYSNTFTCIPDSVMFRPPRLTPKPIVQGIQTAVVVGPKGEEIYCDKYGRVKVQFHWDREGKKNEQSSCFIRSAHNIAGKQWGFMAIPRIGQEVVVDFLEGDPDCPLIVGSVYNAGQMPHYSLPAEQSRSYIKTNSTKGGKGFNELMFEDKAGDERVFIHGEKNMDVRVKNDSKARIFGNRHQIIGWEKDGAKGGDQQELIYQDKHLQVKRNQIEQVEGNVELLIGHGEAQSGGNLDIMIEKNRTELIGADSDLHVKGNCSQKVDGGMSLSVGGDHQTKSGGNVALEAGSIGEVHIKAGMKVIIEAGMQLSLKGPGGFIDIGPAGVSISGTMVLINSGGAAGAGKGSKPKEPKAAKKAAPKKPELAWDSKTGMKSAPDA